MKKKHLAIAILAIYFGPMCIKWKMTYMNKQELDWVSQYEVGQRMYYISNKKDIDTLEITEKHIYNFCWPISLHVGYNNQFTASCGLHFIIKNKKKALKGALGVIKDEQKEPVNLYFYLGDRFALGELTGPEHSFGLPLLKDMCTIRINGYTFNDCIVIDDRNSEYGDDKSTGISKFIWSKSKGLLLYVFKNGDFFIRKEYSKPTSPNLLHENVQFQQSHWAL